MGQTLDALLAVLHTDEAKASFLGRIYLVGKTDVARKIVESNLNSDKVEIALKEVEYCFENGLEDDFKYFARFLIDYHAEGGYVHQLKDRIIAWNNVDIARYAISGIDDKGDDFLFMQKKFAITIANAFGMEAEAKEFLEEILEEQQKREDEYNIPRTLIRLKRYEEALRWHVTYIPFSGHWDEVIEACTSELPSDLVNEILEKLCISYEAEPSLSNVGRYLNAAKKIGRVDKAREVIETYSQGLEMDFGSHRYGALIASLVDIGAEQKAKELVRRIRKLVEPKESVRLGIDTSIIDLAQLYHLVGDTEQVRKLYSRVIRDRERQRNSVNRQETLRYAKKAYELTQDPIFLRFQLRIIERITYNDNYKQAEDLARQLGDEDLASKYAKMQELFDTTRKIRTQQTIETLRKQRGI